MKRFITYFTFVFCVPILDSSLLIAEDEVILNLATPMTETSAAVGVVVPTTGNVEPSCSTCTDESKKEFNWKKVPPIHAQARTGNFPILPSGYGDYSFLDVLQGKVRKERPKSAYPSFALITNTAI